MLQIAIPIGLGAAIGFCIGLTGVGGGVLVLPALAVVLGFKATLAVGTATAFSALSKIFATWEHQRLGNVDHYIAGSMLAGAVPTVVTVALYVKSQAQIPGFQYILGWVITGAIALAAVLMAVRALYPPKNAQEPGKDANSAQSRPEDPDNPAPIASFGRFSPLAAGFGVIVGALIAATSVGGGVIIMPMLVFGFAMRMRRVIGTAIVVSLVLSVVTSMVYHFAGPASEVDLSAASWMFVGSLLGIRAGSRLTTRWTDRALLWASIVMIAAAVVAMTGRMLTV